MNDLNCPYCGADNEVCHDDGAGYDEGKLHEMQCAECDKYFTFHTFISFDYTPHKADCLNGSDHKFKPTITIPRWLTRMKCSYCEKERTPTSDEWVDICLDDGNADHLSELNVRPDLLEVTE